MNLFQTFIVILVYAAAIVPRAGGQGIEQFEKHIRPLLVERCYECHSSAATKLKGGLRLDSRAGWETGGNSGPAIIPGNPDASLLIRAVLSTEDDVRMPPKKRLTQTEIGALIEWIKQGAVDPRLDTMDPKPASVRAVHATNHWAYRPIARPRIPETKDNVWPRGNIDRFVLARLETAGLKPGPDATAAALGRRLCFDLAGLPPSVDELRQFEWAANRDRWAAIAGYAAALLASPRYGEHWGRHWLDVVRFGESVTLRGLIFKQAWRYRDYVIEAYNQDSPFDQMIKEQIAGDLMPSRSIAERRRQLTAATFLTLGNWNLEEQDKQQLDMDVVDEQLDTLGKAFLGQTLGCARCHDHKFDPIPTRDYYALAGILKNCRTLKHANVSDWVEVPLPVEAALETGLRQQEKLVAELQAEVKGAKEASTRVALESRLKTIRAAGPVRPMVMAVLENAKFEDTQIHVRGSVHQLAGRVPRGFLSAVSIAQMPVVPGDSSGRLELAQWISSPDNPLTARIAANRVWLWLMGEGLVRTPDNFGSTGDTPSHPELLDYLACRLVDGEWSIKRLVEEIAGSRTYGLAVKPPVSNLEPVERKRSLDRSEPDPDPANRLLRYAHRKRLTAEQLRDAMLLVSGQLSLDMGGASFAAERDADYGFVYDGNLRSVYVPVFRNALPELFEVFDFAPSSMVTGRRTESTVPAQALFMMNSGFVRTHAQIAALRLLREFPRDPSRRIHLASKLILGREPSASEIKVGLEYLNSASVGDSVVEKCADWVHALFASADFRYLE